MLKRATAIAKHYVRTLQSVAMYFPGDLLDSLTGRRETYTPPRRLWFVGGGDFGQIGGEFFKYFVELCGLKPNDKVLDVGCGIGRMAIPMLDYLTTGSYDGFDIVPAGIRWSSRVITSRHPNFRFKLANIHNQIYHPTGRYTASEYRFPYDNASFDFVLLTSVVTHLMPPDVEHYMVEIARVLKPKGRTLITWFVLNEESKSLIEQKLGSYDFHYRTTEFWSISRTNPEHAVAYEEERIRSLYSQNGLQIEEPIRYGSWPGRKDYLSAQDIIISHKL